LIEIKGHETFGRGARGGQFGAGADPPGLTSIKSIVAVNDL